MNQENPDTCLNCGHILPENAKYCPQCSQKNTDGRVPVWTFITDFFANLFNIDSKLIRTFLALFIPGKLTKEYFQGKHKSFANPVRLFLYAGVSLFAVVIWQTSDIDFGVDKTFYQKQADEVHIRQVLDDKVDLYREAFQDTSKYYQTDSLKTWVIRELDTGAGDSMKVLNIFGEKKELVVATIDFVDLSTDSLISKYGVTSSFDQFLLDRQIRSMKDGRGLFHFFIGKLPIMIFFMMPFLALILLILYARHNYFFVEHLVFSFHTHTFAFIIVLVLVATGKYLPGLGIAALIIGIFVYQFIAQKRYYGQGFWKTTLKFLLLNFLYIFLVILFFTLAVAISFALF